MNERLFIFFLCFTPVEQCFFRARTVWLYWGLADFRRFPGDRPFEQPLLQSEEEANQFSGIFWMLAGYTATIWLIPDYKLAIVGIWYLVVGDGFAGLVGKTWGRHLIGSGPKTWEGSLACWVGCLIVGTILMRGSMAWWIPAVGATATSFVEWLPMPWNDNFSLPLLSSVFLCLFLNS